MFAALVCNRAVLRVVGPAMRVAVALAAVVLLAGCLGTGTSGTSGTGNAGTPGTPGTGDSGGNGYGGQGGSADGGQGTPGGAGGIGGDGGDGYGGWGGNGYGGDGGSADGGNGTSGVPGANGGSGLDGAPGNSYSSSDSIVGSGRLTSRLIDVSGVNSLVVGADFVVRLNLGGSEQAKITMDDNLADRVQARVISGATGNELRLGLIPGTHVRRATLTAEITVVQMDRLATSGASRVVLTSAPTGPALRLVATGASAITGPIQVDRLQATAAGTATLALSGQVRELQLNGAGTSRLLLADLAVRNLDIVLSGASHATVTVSDTLAAQTTGASALRYRGNPNITREQASGASSIAQDAI